MKDGVTLKTYEYVGVLGAGVNVIQFGRQTVIASQLITILMPLIFFCILCPLCYNVQQ